MILLLRLALRNVARQKMRSLLSTVAIVAGVAVLIAGRGFVQGIKENIIRASVDSVSAHLLVREVDYPTRGIQHPLDHLIELTPALQATLGQAQSWTPRTMFTATAIYEVRNMRVRGIGYDPVRDPLVFPRDTWRIEGVDPKSGEGVLVGRGVARLLGVGPGDSIVMQARTPDGAINALDMNVAGTFSTGNPVLDQMAIFVPTLLHESLLNTDKPSHLAVRMRRRDQALTYADTLAATIDEHHEVVTWKEETQAMIDAQQIRQQALNLIVFVLMGMSAMGIANTVLMAAYERVAEIGTLRAMGMTRKLVVALFVTEGTLIGLVGGAVGAAAGGALMYYLSTTGIDLSPMLEQGTTGSVPIAAMLYTEYSTAVVLLAWVFGVVVAVGASIYPAVIASRMAPADAVRAR